VYHADTTLSELILHSVTQIPLDNPTIPQELTVSSVRPPWIRPARKKIPSAPRSTAGIDSIPQDTSEFVVSPITDALVDTPFSLAGSFSPIAPSQSPRRFSLGTDAPQEELHNPSQPRGGQLGPPKHDPSLGAMSMPSAELMTPFGDGDFDVASLFPRPGMPEFTTDLPDDVSFGQGLLGCGSGGSNGTAGVVGCP
jgi:hypothetical protein